MISRLFAQSFFFSTALDIPQAVVVCISLLEEDCQDNPSNFSTPATRIGASDVMEAA
jgi:hypothetical protein